MATVTSSSHRVRTTIALVHRYVGLTMTIFLVIVGLTGSVLAFQRELDAWLNPELLVVPDPGHGQAPLDPFDLQAKADRADPRVRVDAVPLNLEPGEAWAAWLAPRTDPATGKPFELPFNQILFNPYTGEPTGHRLLGEVTLRPEGLIAFLYRLHYSLALPESTGRTGALILGIVALLWTLDCFVGVYLTLPVRSTGAGVARNSAHGWWVRWKPAWKVRWHGGSYKVNYDLHRAGGLWLWAMLLVFAWSSVAFNLNEVYSPVMKTLFAMRAEQPELPKLEQPLEHPALDWRQAHAQGRRWLQALVQREGAQVDREEYLFLDREHGMYTLNARAVDDLGKFSTLAVSFDANTGALHESQWRGSEKAGDTVTRWLVMLHMAAVGGTAMQGFVCLMGLVITGLAVTGVVVWLRKRKGEQMLRQKSRAAAITRPNSASAKGDQT